MVHKNILVYKSKSSKVTSYVIKQNGTLITNSLLYLQSVAEQIKKLFSDKDYVEISFIPETEIEISPGKNVQRNISLEETEKSQLFHYLEGK